MSKTITPQELNEKLKIKKGNLVCIDVRTEAEHDAERIGNTINC